VRTLRVLVALLTGTLLLTGCDFDVYKLPLPGGTHVDDPMTVKAEFADVMDLVPKSTVKVNDVTVGQITDVQLAGRHAVVTMEIPKDTDLPSNAVAEIHQTSLLGEKFVALSAPQDRPATGHLEDGAVIPLARTGRNPEVEEVLGALSLLLNGGGVAQLKTITDELNKTLQGREGTARDVLVQVRQLMGQLDTRKRDIVHAIDSVNRLAVSVRKQQGSIDRALDELPGALTSLDQQRADLVKMLRSLDRLGAVGVRVINASKAGTVATLQQLNPVLTELGNAGDSFVKSFSVFLTYPFVDEVVGRDPQVARNLHMGDYTNLSIEFDLDLSGLPTGLPTSLPTALPTLLPPSLDPAHLASLLTRCLTSKDGLKSRACQKLIGTAQGLSRLKKACHRKKNRDAAVCQVLNQVPDLPGGGLPSVLPSLLGGLGGGLGGQGLGRAGVGPVRTADPRGPTMGQLTRVFDPALVKLLVPGMVTTR
jgi:phospholipid/cholesterol/gamma-HCH transport system substrate-binding protein